MKIETREEFVALPVGTVVRSDAGTIACRYDDRRAVLFGDERPFPWLDLALPVTVLWPPRCPECGWINNCHKDGCGRDHA